MVLAVFLLERRQTGTHDFIDQKKIACNHSTEIKQFMNQLSFYQSLRWNSLIKMELNQVFFFYRFLITENISIQNFSINIYNSYNINIV